MFRYYNNINNGKHYLFDYINIIMKVLINGVKWMNNYKWISESNFDDNQNDDNHTMISGWWSGLSISL